MPESAAHRLLASIDDFVDFVDVFTPTHTNLNPVLSKAEAVKLDVLEGKIIGLMAVVANGGFAFQER